MSDDRISSLSRRFKTHAVGRPSKSPRTRERRSFYLDVAIVAQLDEAYRKLNHDVYPKEVSKSVFLETVLEYGLAHIEYLKAQLPDNS